MFFLFPKSIFTNINKNNKAFTLVELLIVIVIIGILSGIVITIINPITQQNRAQDAVTISSINKMVLATESYMSAYAQAPDAFEFMAGLSNAYPISDSKCVDDSCIFSLDATNLPDDCFTDFYGNGDKKCYFYYERSQDLNEFFIYAKAHGSDSLYLYKSTGNEKKLVLCPNEYPIYNQDSCKDI